MEFPDNKIYFRFPHSIPFPPAVDVVAAEPLQLIVPGVRDDIINIRLDTAAVGSRFNRLRRGTQMRRKVCHEDFSSTI